VFERAGAQGLAHGLAVGIEDGGSRSIGGFANRDREFTAEEAAVIEETMRALHRATASTTPLTEATRDALRRLSVAFTQP
jgi:LuxR family transcriptional regulator